MDRWGVYETLKGNIGKENALLEIGKMDAEEVKEGLIEFLLVRTLDDEINKGDGINEQRTNIKPIRKLKRQHTSL